ncbi:pyridoxamine 5'-phosphate oxidase family protein [Verrucomicrobiota bacterium]
MNAKDKVSKIVEHHNLMHLATVDSEGMPKCRGVDFVANDTGSNIYFLTRKDSNKIKEIRGNKNVFVVIDHDCPTAEDLGALKYIKASGTASIIQDPEEAQKAFGMLMKKFPFMKDLPGEPSDFVAVKVILDKVDLTDNTVGFGHTETVQLD